MPNPTQPHASRTRRAKAAFAQHLDEIRSVPPRALLPVNISVEATVDRVLSVAPHLAALRQDIAEHLPNFEVATVDHLEGYALALHYSNLLCLQPVNGAPGTQTLVASAIRCRAHLLDDAKALARHQLLCCTDLSRFSGKPTREQLALHITELVRMVREQWPRVSDKTALTLRQLRAAEELARLLTQTVADSATAAARRRDHALIRAQAFTLLVRAYNELRRAVMYLRWNERDTLVPSLYADRKRASQASVRAPKRASERRSISSAPHP